MGEFERGFAAGWAAYYHESNDLARRANMPSAKLSPTYRDEAFDLIGMYRDNPIDGPKAKKPKRKLSAWNKFVKANSKKPRFIFKSGAKKGKLNLKSMAVAFRKTPAGKKSKK